MGSGEIFSSKIEDADVAKSDATRGISPELLVFEIGDFVAVLMSRATLLILT